LNWGGFVNHSFSVTDGAVQYHLKITSDSDSKGKLQAWSKIHDLLERRYRAPQLIDWIEFSEIQFAGLLFEHIESTTADFYRNPALVGDLVDLANSLHNDVDIQSHLDASRSRKTYLDHFVETYVDRFTADLECIAADRPPFISAPLFKWMQ